MCGIIGIASKKAVSSNIIHSLKKLEYRGYDSAGIATIDGGEIEVTVEPTKEQMEELEDEIRIITSEKDLNEEELNELSREIGKTETTEEPTPINPTKEELEKLEEILNITYNDEDVPFDRITDTTKTFVDNTNINDDELDDEGRTLRYKGR